MICPEADMRIDRLTVQNFKKFTEQTFALHPQFTLLVGENGSGKTAVLDALAVSLGIWLVEAPDTSLHNSRRNILTTEIRLEPSHAGDRIQFREKLPVLVQATGQIGPLQNVTWTRQIKQGGKRTTNADAKEALVMIRGIYQLDALGQSIICPVLAYYGAGRAWLPSNSRLPAEAKANGAARRWAAFYDCFNERIRFDALRKWFHRETTAAGNRGGRMRPGFEVVRRAVLGCVSQADGLWFDPDREQIVLSIAGHAQPFDNLSAGQRMMLALVADIAIKAVIQNAFLLPPDELGPEDEPLPRLLQQTPRVVLIDELDVHLHPKWQRHVIEDLRRTFPKIQFIATSHSPTIISEVQPESLLLLRQEGDRIIPERCGQAYGLDANYVLEHIMGTTARATPATEAISSVEDALETGDLKTARTRLGKLRALLHGDDAVVVGLEATINNLEALGDAAYSEE
jgi:predicted ATP-binding protein involved in virulence